MSVLSFLPSLAGQPRQSHHCGNQLQINNNKKCTNQLKLFGKIN
jgi:hypothetical protein